MTGDIIHHFFAWAPLTVFITLLVVAYYATKTQIAGPVPIRRTYACAHCGRRGKHEHMVPITHEGAVVWYCARCAQGH